MYIVRIEDMYGIRNKNFSTLEEAQKEFSNQKDMACSSNGRSRIILLQQIDEFTHTWPTIHHLNRIRRALVLHARLRTHLLGGKPCPETHNDFGGH